MASHDYVIDNQTAPNFRADLNNALLAIVSTNSGASAPAVTYANMLWYDTTNNLLRMRNEDNDAFITLGTLNQVADTFSPAGLNNLSQAQVENPASVDFGQVSGQRLEQQTNASFNVSGSAPKYACRAWVNFDASTGTVVIRDSGNVSSITRVGTDNYQVNFTTALEDASFVVTSSMMIVDGLSGIRFNGVGARTASSFKCYCGSDNRAGSTTLFNDFAVFR